MEVAGILEEQQEKVFKEMKEGGMEGTRVETEKQRNSLNDDRYNWKGRR